jgi:putative membrane protein
MNYYVSQWLMSSLAVMVMAQVVPGITVQNFAAALVAALVIGVINMLVWPIMVFLTIPLTVLSFGLFLFVVNGLALKLSAGLTPGFTIVGFLPAILGSIVLSLIGWIVRFVFLVPASIP